MLYEVGRVWFLTKEWRIIIACGIQTIRNAPKGSPELLRGRTDPLITSMKQIKIGSFDS